MIGMVLIPTDHAPEGFLIVPLGLFLRREKRGGVLRGTRMVGRDLSLSCSSSTPFLVEKAQVEGEQSLDSDLFLC
jgi:hypothetical protein